MQRASIDSCCTTGANTSDYTIGMKHRSEKGRHSASPKAKEDTCVKGCCEEAKISDNSDSCKNNIYQTEQRPNGSIAKPKEIFTNVAYIADIEKRFSGKEHAILTISGVTCTGCETKLKRTLGTVESVRNLKTSLILARAEVDLDLGAGSLLEVMKHPERTTEFKCERVMNE